MIGLVIAYTSIPETLCTNAIHIHNCITKLRRFQCRQRSSIFVLAVYKLLYERVLIVQVAVWVDLLHDLIQMLERLAGSVDAAAFITLVL